MNTSNNTNNVLGLRGNTVDTREDSTSNTNYNITFCKNKKNQSLLYDTSLHYNPSTETLTVPNISTSGPLNASTINITDTDTAGTYYLTFVDDSGNTKTLRCDKTLTALSYNPNTGIFNAEKFNGEFLTIDSTPNNSDFLLTCITPTPSTYNQILYTDITYNPQTNILKVGKLDNCFALTSSGGNLPILFIDHTSTGKQFLYNSGLFYINPTLGEFLLQGNITTQNISASEITITGNGGLLNLEGSDHCYIQFYPDTISAGRKGYLGYPGSAIDDLVMVNQNSNAGIGLYTTGGNLFINNSGDVGIANTSPLVPLHIIGSSAGPTSTGLDGIVQIATNTGQNDNKLCLGVENGDYSWLQAYKYNTSFEYGNLCLNPAGGNVAIGTSLTQWNLRVDEDAHFGDDLDNSKYGMVQITRPGNQGDTKFHQSFVRNGHTVCGLGFLNNSSVFAIQNQSNNNTSSNGIFMTGNLVGINNSAPSQPLDVTGIINYTDRLIGGQSNGAENNHIDCYDSGSSTTRGIYLNYYANSGSGYACYINASPSPRTAGLACFGTSLFTGFISKSGGGFNIKHPLLGDNYRLVHSFGEAPKADNIYRGKAQLINGTIDVNLDTENNMTEGTFIALNTNFNVYVNNNDENSWNLVKGKLNGNILTIYSNNPECNAVIDYLVIAERHDEFMKSDTNDATDCCGKIIVERPATKTECNSFVNKDNEGSNNWKDYYKENCQCIDPYKCYDLH